MEWWAVRLRSLMYTGTRRRFTHSWDTRGFKNQTMGVGTRGRKSNMRKNATSFKCIVARDQNWPLRPNAGSVILQIVQLVRERTSKRMRSRYFDIVFIPFIVFAIPFSLPPSFTSDPGHIRGCSPPLMGGAYLGNTIVRYEGKTQIEQTIRNQSATNAARNGQHQK